MNYNKLLFIMPGADGLKTGHTDKGGYGMVASATAGGRRLIGVINGFHGKGHDALAAEMKSLLTHGFNTTTTKVFYRPGDDVTAVPVWYGRDGRVTGTVDRTFAITTPKESGLSDVRVLARYTDPMPAPIHAGDVLGEVIAERDGNVIARTNLVAKNDVGRVRFLARAWRNIVVMLTGR